MTFWRRPLLFLFAWSMLSWLTGCKSATQAKVGLYTNVAFEDGLSVAAWAGPVTEPQVRAPGPWANDGRVGDFVAVPPSDNRDARLGLRVVLAVGRDPAGCSLQDARNCIIARRNTRYLAHQQLNVPISLYAQCLGVACSDETTCNSQGRCVPAELDPEACVSQGGCVLPGDPPNPPQVEPKVPDAGADAPVVLPEELPPQSVALGYRDADPKPFVTMGQLTVKAPRDGPAYDGVEVRWADEEGKTVAPFLDLPKAAFTDGSAQHAVLPGTKVPAGAGQFVAVAYRRSQSLGKLYGPPARVRADNFPRMVDIGGDAGVDAFPGAIRVGPGADRITQIGTDAAGHPGLRICKADGTSCSARVLAPEVRTGRGVGWVFDDEAGTALFAVTDSLTERPFLLSCKNDGTGCARTDLQTLTGLTGRQTRSFEGVLEPGTKKAVFVTTSPDTLRHLLFRCDMNGAACTVRSMEDEAGLSRGIYVNPNRDPFLSIALDPVTGTLYTADSDAGAVVGKRHLGLFRCPLAAPSCAYSDLSAQTGIDAQEEFCPIVMFDEVARKVRIATTRRYILGQLTDFGRPYVFSAGLDGSGATAQPLAETNDVSTTDLFSTATLDRTSNKLLFLVGNGVYDPALHRCAPDGRNCSRRFITLGTNIGAFDMFQPGLTLDNATGRFLIQFRDQVRRSRPTLLSCPFSGLACAQTDMSIASQRGSIVGIGRTERTLDAAVDAVRSKLVVSLSGAASDSRAVLIQCDLDGKSCVSSDASADQAAFSSQRPTLAVLPGSTQVAIAASDDQAGRPTVLSLYMCPTNGAACTWRDGTAGLGADSARAPIIGALPGSGELRVLLGSRKNDNITTAEAGFPPAFLTSCDATGLGCTTQALGNAPKREFQTGNIEDGKPIGIVGLGATRELFRCTAESPPVCTATPFGGPAVPPGFSDIRHNDLRSIGTDALALASVVTGSREPGFMLSVCDARLEKCRSRTFAVAPGVLRYGNIVFQATSKVVVDDAQKFMYFTHSVSSLVLQSGATELWRCAVSDLACERILLDTNIHGATPAPVIDRAAGRLYVVANNYDARLRPVAIMLDLW
jgi:hypothetical protein